MDHIAILLEQVYFLDSLNGLDVELLEGLLKLLVVRGRSLRSAFDLSSSSALSTKIRSALHFPLASPKLYGSSLLSGFQHAMPLAAVPNGRHGAEKGRLREAW